MSEQVLTGLSPCDRQTESYIRTSSPQRVGRKRYKDQEEQNPWGNVKGTIHEWKNRSTHRSLCYKHEHTHTPTSSHAANSKRALLIRRNVTSGVPWAQIFYFINRLYSHSARRTPLDQNKSNCFDNFFYFVTYKKPKTLKSWTPGSWVYLRREAVSLMFCMHSYHHSEACSHTNVKTRVDLDF